MFRSRNAFQELVQANPVPVSDARALAARVGLDETVRYRIAWEPQIAATSGSAALAFGSVRRTRSQPIRIPRLALVGAAVAAALAALAASPALGFLKQSVLPFFGLESALPASKSTSARSRLARPRGWTRGRSQIRRAR